VSDPVYILGAAPTFNVRVRTLTRDRGVRELLENPPHRRDAGWNLVTLERAELRPGPRLHIQNGDRKYLDLHEDGTLTAIGRVDQFLGHGRWDFSQKPLINGLALVEFTYEFVSFYELLMGQFFEPLPQGVRFAVGIRDAHFRRRRYDEELDRYLLLAPGPVGDFYGFERELHPAPESTLQAHAEVTVSADEPHIDVPRVSFDLLRRVFNFFGFTDDAVPYARPETDAIDFDLITGSDHR
jgi:hypothetical protein